MSTIQRITGLKASPLQSLTVADPNTGDSISITLTYRPRVQGWFIDLSFRTFVLHGYKLFRSPNALDKFSNEIPFGLMVVSSDHSEPFLVNDFTSGRISLYLLTSEQVAEIQAAIEDGSLI